jgi:hypothetical protein
MIVSGRVIPLHPELRERWFGCASKPTTQTARLAAAIALLGHAILQLEDFRVLHILGMAYQIAYSGFRSN